MSKRIKNTLIFFGAVLIVAYLGYKFYQTAFPTYTFETAVKTDFRDKMYKECYIIRDEQIIYEDGEGIRSYTVQNGTRVSKDSPVLYLYDGEEEASNAARLKEIDAEIELLESIEVSLSSVGEIENVRVSLKEEFKNLYANLEKGNLSTLNAEKNNILYLLSKKQLIVGDTGNFEDRIAELNAEREELLAKQTVEPKTVNSPDTGYFIADIDGYEGLASTEDIKTMTPDGLKSLFTAKPTKVEASAIGKLVSNYHWYICMTVTADEIRQIKERSTLSINIPSLSLTGVDVTVDSINYDESRENAVLVLRCGYMSTSISTLRTAQIELNLKAYNGIRINSEAIHFEDNVEGVYVVVGSQIKFRKINIIYTGKGYVISEIDTSDSKTVQPYDEIVLSGKELYDGKFIK